MYGIYVNKQTTTALKSKYAYISYLSTRAVKFF